MSKVVLKRKGITEEEWTGRNISYISWNEDKTFKDIRY